MSALSADREKALDQIAGGWSRKPTTAHPDCLCGGRAQYTRIWFYEGYSGVMVLPAGWGPVQVPCPLHSRPVGGDTDA